MNSIVCAFAPSIMIALKRDDHTTTASTNHTNQPLSWRRCVSQLGRSAHRSRTGNRVFRSIYIHKSTVTRWFVTFHVILQRDRSKYIPSWTVSAHSGVQPVKKMPSTIAPHSMRSSVTSTNEITPIVRQPNARERRVYMCTRLARLLCHRVRELTSTNDTLMWRR